MGVELVQMHEGGALVFDASITFDDATFAVTRVDWDNPGPRDWLLTLQAPGVPDIETVIRAGRSGRRTGGLGGYFVDGPLGAGYQLRAV